jgi:hypothetical protein
VPLEGTADGAPLPGLAAMPAPGDPAPGEPLPQAEVTSMSVVTTTARRAIRVVIRPLLVPDVRFLQ